MYHQAIDTLGRECKKLTSDYVFESDDCTFNINIPKRNKYDKKNDNNQSLVISMELKETKFLFCADAMELRLTEIIDTLCGKYDVIKLPYHGNYLENYNNFLIKSVQIFML